MRLFGHFLDVADLKILISFLFFLKVFVGDKHERLPLK